MAERKHVRCAIYTRKSSEEGLEQDFNSLDAQREACAAYIASQKHEGWTELPARYDDGGFSGGTLERPGLARLLHDIRARRVDVIVVYKVDRLTRSLADFAKIVEVLDAQGISFVAVTQHFNTTTSMGRLTLNVLLSFAQFEREIAGERIRDKIKASRQKGMWMGGNVPLGYEVKDRALVVNETEAKKVRLIFRRYLELGSVNALAVDLDRKRIRSHRRITQGGRTIGGKPITRGNLYLILQNRAYLGMVVHKGTSYQGLHRPIIERGAWDRVQAQLAKNRVDHCRQTRARVPSLLTGLLFDSGGERLTPSHSNRDGLRYRYYISKSLARGRPREDEQGKRWRIPATEIESAVLAAVSSYLNDHSALSSILSLRRLPPAQAGGVLKVATALSRSLSQEHTGQLRSKLQSLLSRIEIGDTTLTLTVALGRLREALKRPALALDEPETHAIVVPVRITKRGIEQKLMIGGGVMAPVPRDETLVKAVARAYSWFEDIRMRRVNDLSELAVREQLPRSYVQAHLPLAFLAPSIVGAILKGRQPADLSLKQLMYRTDLAVEWCAQRRRLRFET
jgi:DNA invertase Pin-like site-specific DNA recombinase